MSLKIYLVGVIAIVFLPFPIDKRFIQIFQKTGYVFPNFIPFKSIVLLLGRESIAEASKQILGNVILFMPLGFFIPVVFNKMNYLKKIIILGISLSFIIEISQLMLSLYLQYTYKFTDIDDIILNTLGCIIGLYILKITAPIVEYIIEVPIIKFTIRNKAT